MMTNISEVFNFVLKGIRSLTIYDIVAYIFHKCNEYFVDSWKKACNAIAKGERWGNLDKITFVSRARYPAMKLLLYLM
jgi:hypothetical protein